MSRSVSKQKAGHYTLVKLTVNRSNNHELEFYPLVCCGKHYASAASSGAEESLGNTKPRATGVPIVCGWQSLFNIRHKHLIKYTCSTELVVIIIDICVKK